MTGDIPNYGSEKKITMKRGSFLTDVTSTIADIYATGATISNTTAETSSVNGIYLNECTISDSAFYQKVYISGSSIENTVFSGYSIGFSACSFDDVVLSGDVSFYYSTYDEHGGNGYYVKDNELNGTLTLKADSIRWAGDLNANGNTIILDLTEKTTESAAILNGAAIRNAEIVLTVKANQVIGTYALGTNSSQIGQIDTQWIWDADTDTWQNQSFVIGDLDGVIELRDENGFLLANCTINGNTEYNGRYHYTVHTDSSGIMYLDIGRNATENPSALTGDMDGISWSDISTVDGFIVEYSADDFVHSAQIHASSNKLDTWNLPIDIYRWRVKINNGTDEWATGTKIVSNISVSDPQIHKSDADQVPDVFFVQFKEQWTSQYAAQHVGSINAWGGTLEQVSLTGKNKIEDVFEGSPDTNILFLTDDVNGDALFVDDIYSAFSANPQSRIAQIDEIRAGAGDDIVDMTSQRFEYIGDGLTIRGGDGNDVIWANKGDNMLFGDAGNDRLVGASGNDVLAGGIGKDRMHGGGGSDIFVFCGSWGADTVEQLAYGDVTLWFESGSPDNWDASTLTYTDGTSSVKVSGVTADKVSLKFGDDGSEQYAALAGQGAFLDSSSEKIFEEQGKGILAAL